MVKTPLKELAAKTGYSENWCAKLRMRGLSDEQILEHEPENNHGSRGAWEGLPKRTHEDQEKLLDSIPGPTRFDMDY